MSTSKTAPSDRASTDRADSSAPLRVAATRVGRHVVIEELGAGGMGVVYAAYDPQLDRKIAIKVLRRRARSTKASAGLVREAKAMAQVSHPNVISVFDVGTDADDVYIAMEFAGGGTLRSWLKDPSTPQPWKAVLDAFVDAGKGLGAAHAAGLVHGDFKPDNVLLGDRGQVLVTDFGLARRGRSSPTPTEHSGGTLVTQETQGLYGTPAYMAPEQFRRMQPDERSDQFSFCVALYEGLFGERPFAGNTAAALASSIFSGRMRKPKRHTAVPAWLLDVVRRGLAINPEQRWATMEDLLSALRADPTRRRRVLAAGAGVALVAAAVGSAAWTQHRLRVESCHEHGASIDAVWGASQREAVADALAASGSDNAEQTLAKTTPWLDDYAAAWARARTSSCMAARVHEHLAADDYAATRSCLDDLRAQLEARVEILVVPNSTVTQHAVSLASGLPSLHSCDDGPALAARPQPPGDDAARAGVQEIRRLLITADTQQVAGTYEAGTATAREALRRAETLGWPPLVAEAKLRLGQLRRRAGAFDEGRRLLEDAAVLAAESHHDTVAADACIDLTVLTGTDLAEFEVGRLWAQWAGAYVNRLGEAEGPRGAVRHNALGGLFTRMGQTDRAGEAYQRAAELQRELFGPRHPNVATSLSNLGNVMQTRGDHDEAIATYTQAMEIRIDLLGADHPHVADVHQGIGNTQFFRGEGTAALRSYSRALEIRMAALGPAHANTAGTLLMMANAHSVLGNVDAEVEYCERALAVYERALGPEHVELAQALGNLGGAYRHQGRIDDAVTALRRGLAIQRKVYDEPHEAMVPTLNELANIERDRAQTETAAAYYAEAVHVAEEALGRQHLLVAFPLSGWGELMLGVDRPLEAIPLLQRAYEIRASPDAPGAKRAFTGFALARALWAAKTDQDRALELATEAHRLFTAGGEPDKEYADEVATWLEATASRAKDEERSAGDAADGL